MSTGMFAAVSGIRANQSRLNVISNNIANVNTTGFKTSSADFATVFSSTISGGSAANGSLGGTNPIQIGNGSLLSDINSNFSQGGTQYTGRSTDMMINGNGFFAVERIDANNGNNASDYYLTRSGNFSLDESGNLVTSSGNRVRGSANIAGNDPTTLGRVQIPQEFQVTKDLDSLGKTLQIHVSSVGTDESAAGPIVAAMNTNAVSQNTVKVNLVSFSVGTDGAIAAKYSNGDTITVRTDQWTINNSPTDPSQWIRELVYQPAGGGTYPSDDLRTTDAGYVDEVGAVGAKAVFDGGVGLAVGAGGMMGMQMQIQTASVINPQGLLYDGNNNFLAGANSGTPAFGMANSGAVGNINSGALESSNVDIAGEFTNLMITQRGLEAASKVVKAQSEVMQTIIQML